MEGSSFAFGNIVMLHEWNCMAVLASTSVWIYGASFVLAVVRRCEVKITLIWDHFRM